MAETPHTHTPPSMTPRRSTKGKDRAADEASINSIEIEGEMVIGSGSARMGLRDLVKRSSGISRSGETSRARTVSISRRRLSRQYYILTHAGKLVFASGENEQVQSLMGVAQALVSIYAAEDDRPRSIIRGKSRISFLLKAPLYLFCVSDWGEPEHVLRTHLEYIHLQVLSIVTSTQLAKAFQRRSNFDLSRLLEGTEHFLHTLIKRAQHDFSYLTSSLEPLRMAPSLREAAAAALMPPAKFRDLLYVLLIASGRIVTLLRPRKHSIHPSDLHLLLNTLAASPTLTSSETWIPICFPKFNPAGYVHAYISPVTEDITLVFISADREAFNDLQGWKDIVVEKLARDQTLSRISQAIPLHSYSVSAVSLPGLYHFIYKSRQSIQITAPSWEPPYDGAARDRLITLYQHLHDSLHAKAGQAEPLRLVYVKTQHEACLGWMTKPFELYMAVSPHLSKAAVVSAANAVATFMSKEEARVFIKDAPVF